MPLKHLAGDLGVAWFVGPDQPELSEPVEEKKDAESDQQQPLAGTLAHERVPVCREMEPSLASNPGLAEREV